MRTGLALGVGFAAALVGHGALPLGAEEPPLPTSPPIEVVICDSHHEVLRHWLRATSGDHPQQRVTVVHFDAHPDLAVPTAPVSTFVREADADFAALTAGLDIASFQLAAVWLGLVDRIVWLRPDWAHQLPDGERRFHLGLDSSGRLRVDDPSDYFVFDEAWAPTASLRDAVELELRVLPLSKAAEAGVLATGPTILDIDLDGFATRNPAIEALRRAGFSDVDLDRLRSVFDPRKLRFSADPATRIGELESLLGAVEAVASEDLLDQLKGAFSLWRFGIGLGELLGLARILERITPDASLETLLEDGRNLVGLPEFTADAQSIQQTASQLGALLKSGAVRPMLISISRSGRDGYTPLEDWPAIEWQLLRAINRAVDELEVHFDSGLSPAPGPFSIGVRPLGVREGQAPALR